VVCAAIVLPLDQISDLKRNNGSVMYATFMQQKCCKYAV